MLEFKDTGVGLLEGINKLGPPGMNLDLQEGTRILKCSYYLQPWWCGGPAGQAGAPPQRAKHTPSPGVGEAEGRARARKGRCRSNCCFMPMRWVCRELTTCMSYRSACPTLLHVRKQKLLLQFQVKMSLWLTLIRNRKGILGNKIQLSPADTVQSHRMTKSRPTSKVDLTSTPLSSAWMSFHHHLLLELQELPHKLVFLLSFLPCRQKSAGFVQKSITMLSFA